MPIESPFTVLQLKPTLDPAQIKRAYFAALARHPPHQDAEQFRRVRAAYEELTSPIGLATAYASAPLELEPALGAYRAAYDARLEAAGDKGRAEQDVGARAAAFAETYSRMSWEQACRSET